MNEIIILLIILLLFIDYHHKQYNIKKSMKRIAYRNSHSYYDDTNYNNFELYREIYTYKILILFLIIILLINFISEPASFFKLLNNLLQTWND